MKNLATRSCSEYAKQDVSKGDLNAWHDLTHKKNGQTPIIPHKSITYLLGSQIKAF